MEITSHREFSVMIITKETELFHTKRKKRKGDFPAGNGKRYSEIRKEYEKHET